jgi:hypothetical protein
LNREICRTDIGRALATVAADLQLPVVRVLKGNAAVRDEKFSTIKQVPDLTYGDVRLFMTRGNAANGLEAVDIVMLKRDGSLAR